MSRLLCLCSGQPDLPTLWASARKTLLYGTEAWSACPLFSQVRSWVMYGLYSRVCFCFDKTCKTIEVASA